MPEPIIDKKDQYERVRAYCIPGEQIYGVFDCKGGGTGFVGIADRRVIFYDQGIFIKKKSMISIPYNQIIGIASVDEGMIFQTSEIRSSLPLESFPSNFAAAIKPTKSMPTS